MAMLTVSASEARSNFSRLGEEIARSGRPVTVFKNSKPWLVIAPAGAAEEREERVTEAVQQAEMSELLRIAAEIDAEYFDVFEALAK
ncbi:MAG: type II toxin-antitoxin system Phd/YefM family antitoxin [Coriobacteriales bacterium]|jgi:antitoxin Phd|nr:type II toxin-antitoxin system Phd/YefM family antitoxin [Coriobacteriales bacterium]